MPIIFRRVRLNASTFRSVRSVFRLCMQKPAWTLRIKLRKGRYFCTAETTVILKSCFFLCCILPKTVTMCIFLKGRGRAAFCACRERLLRTNGKNRLRRSSIISAWTTLLSSALRWAECLRPEPPHSKNALSRLSHGRCFRIFYTYLSPIYPIRCKIFLKRCCVFA